MAGLGEGPAVRAAAGEADETGDAVVRAGGGRKGRGVTAPAFSYFPVPELRLLLS